MHVCYTVNRLMHVCYTTFSTPLPPPHICHIHTVKGARGKVSFDSLNVKYASKLFCYASPEAYLSHLTSKITNALLVFLSDKYASGEASLDSCEAYLSSIRLSTLLASGSPLPAGDTVHCVHLYSGGKILSTTRE
jgi:hypothetical protein